MITALGELADAIETFVEGLAGWRYIFSSSYRKQTHSRWRQQSHLAVVFDILGASIGVFFTLLLVGFVGYLFL